MKVKKIWTELDFEKMGWHDSYIYNISFPDENQKLKLDIDYIFKWVLDERVNSYSFWISPCDLIFENVLYLRINLDYQNTIGLDIQNIKRFNPRVSPNGNILLWDYEILTNVGSITFESSGYIQKVKKQPMFSESQVLMR